MRAYTRESILAIEDRVIGGDQRSAFELMKRAGAAAYGVLRQRFPDARRIQVLCGSGNNAGDGYVLAALAQADAVATGHHVEIVPVGKPPRTSQTAWQAYEMALRAGVPMAESYPSETPPPQLDLIVDALLGTGIKGAPRPEFAAAIATINASGAKVLALDIPSGMNPDTGAALPTMVRADVTVSFIGAKRGMLTGVGKAATGVLIVDRLGLSDTDYQTQRGHTLIDWVGLRSALPALDLNAHKHRLGHLLVIGGDLGMGGAAIMAAESALRVGTGLVTLATRPEHLPAVLARCPEVMTLEMGHPTQDDRGHTTFGRGHPTQEAMGHPTLPTHFDAIVVGPGLGRGEWGAELLRMATEANLPMLVDGDGLTLLQDAAPQLSVLTPHPGEAARMLGCQTNQINEDRFSAVKQLADSHGCVALLKGAGSLIATPDTSPSEIDICAGGNPGMATAGSGDVLAGIIGGFLAQGLNPLDATRCGACLHAAAGDLAAHHVGQRSLKATDIITHLPELLREHD